MKITSAELVISAAAPKQFPPTKVPEVAFAGRSNVGKSTLINSLLNRKNLVKTSSTPGKTQLINFFRINQSFHCVDLPGYGFAKVPAPLRRSWQALTEVYLSRREPLRGVVLIIDSRQGPTAGDVQLKQWLDAS
ncbi:MAG: ribosome biogenesis GTP-binding protein YihA/YsxC, partial [SAR324 cluster bacterium]|nr:ribosome biogenesis GTP-binding protein YihA/YsxC [SAR324 cluster bacterium]